jgi:hypothetical protein
MAETVFDRRSLTPVRAAIVASRLSDNATVSFMQNDDNKITRVNVRFTKSVWNECDDLIKHHNFIISPKSARENFIEVFSNV